MANTEHGSGYIGEMSIDDSLSFMIRIEDFSFVPTHFDILSGDGTVIIGDVSFTVAGVSGYMVDLRIPSGLPVLSTDNGFIENQTYQILIKSTNSSNPGAANYELGPRFNVGSRKTMLADTSIIQRVDLADGSASTFPDSLVGRLLTIEKNQIENISPKLRRVLGFLGENQVLDAAIFDEASNVVSMRMRIYDTADNAKAAIRWADTEGVDSDPVAAFPTTGEQLRHYIKAEHALPRQLRTVLEGTINTSDGGSGDANDQQYDESSAL